MIKTGANLTNDFLKYRQDFPILSEKINGYPLVYFDNAATTQRPLSVIEAIDNFYRHHNANVHRAVHTLGEYATEAFEAARENVRQFIHADSVKEIIFTKGTTEAINLVAQSYARPRLKPGDEVLITHMEHHANIVPWQMVCEQTGAALRVLPIDEQGTLLIDNIEAYFSDSVKLFALTHISNALGTVNPIKKLISLAHQYHIPVLIDGAQALPHTKIDVVALDCDFYCFSGHKMYGPTGIGVLYGKAALLEAMPPYQGGGEMIRKVTFEKTLYNDIPAKFEAGTPPIAEAVGLSAAVDYLQALNIEKAASYEHELLSYATQKAKALEGLKMIGQAPEKGPILSFVFDGIHAHDIGTILNHYGVAVRTGHHCAMPVMDFFKVPATVRASFSFYNTFEEIDQLFFALEKGKEVFA